MSGRMRITLRLTFVMICALLIAVNAANAATAATARAQTTAGGVETMKAPTFGAVTIYSPAPAAGPPKSVVLFISGDGGWNKGVVAMAQQLRDAGALVAGIDIRPFMKSLDASSGCAYPAGALEELSRAVQMRMKVPAYQRPILVGYSSGATLVYAAIAAAPPETFAGAISLGFCPDIEIKQPPCHQGGLTSTKTPKRVGYDLAPYRASTVPWMVLQGDIDQVCDPKGTKAFVAATGAARLFWLPRVGHGFGVPSRWAPQFLDAYRAVVDVKHAREVPRSKTPGVADPRPRGCEISDRARDRTGAIAGDVRGAARRAGFRVSRGEIRQPPHRDARRRTPLRRRLQRPRRARSSLGFRQVGQI